MANFTTSPNMNLVLPTVSIDPGPDWASNVNASLILIDAHNHSPGSGVQISPAGLNINSDLPFGNNNATLLRSSRYSNQGSPLAAASDLSCVYVSGGNLYYNNSAGTAVQITSGSSVNAGAGSITGLPNGTASVTFSANKYVFQSATSTPATLDAGSIIFRNTTASSNGVTVSPVNSVGSNYSLTLPTIPGSTSFLSLDATGAIAPYVSITGGITAGNIASKTLTQGLLANKATGSTVSAGGVATSASCGTFSTTSGTLQSVTNLSVTITTTGRPVYVCIQADGSGDSRWNSGNASGSVIEIRRGSTAIADYELISGSGSTIVVPPPSPFIDVIAAGTYTYSVFLNSIGGATVSLNASILVAYET